MSTHMFRRFRRHPLTEEDLNAFLDGVISDSDEPLLAGVPSIPRGQPMAGQFFPLLYDKVS